MMTWDLSNVRLSCFDRKGKLDNEVWISKYYFRQQYPINKCLIWKSQRNDFDKQEVYIKKYFCPFFTKILLDQINLIFINCIVTPSVKFVFINDINSECFRNLIFGIYS
jgi:hypothetical protein